MRIYDVQYLRTTSLRHPSKAGGTFREITVCYERINNLPWEVSVVYNHDTWVKNNRMQRFQACDTCYVDGAVIHEVFPNGPVF